MTIRLMQQDDIADLQNFYISLGKTNPDITPDYFDKLWIRQKKGASDIYLAVQGDDIIAYGVLNWQPKYGLYQKLGIPEIQDLNVSRDHRQKGIATAIIEHCEKVAKSKGCDQMGISFGLDASFGAAQRLYIKLGYIPDGQGVTYDRQYVLSGESKPIDDDLCLMLVKDLR